jgi:tetratricopeptide (TPR) repeat protein
MGADSLNAMAALLAHEITHYYENHDWSRNFVRSNKDLSVSSKIEALNEGLKFEVQADYLGGILAISAGYNTYRVFDQFLNQAYVAYDLPEEIEGYPDLQERLTMSAKTAERLKQLHNVYDMANLLTLLEAHEKADQYYQYLLTDYQSYEVYNNAGVNACLAALQLTPDKELPFLFPLELDMSSRLDGLNTRAVQDPEKRKAALLKDATSWFKNAIEMAPEKPIAYLNLSIVYTLQKEWLDATFWASKALALSQKSGQPKQAADAQIALGIIAGSQGKLDEAKTQFTFALAGNRSLAQTNLSRIEGPAPSPPLITKPARGVEMIDSIILVDIMEDPQFTITSELPNEVFCGKQFLDHSELLLHYAQDGAEYILFHRTCPSYAGTTQKGIRLGDTADDIQLVYGEPVTTLELPSGRCLAYPEQKLLFLLDDKNLLTQWIVYTTHL